MRSQVLFEFRFFELLLVLNPAELLLGQMLHDDEPHVVHHQFLLVRELHGEIALIEEGVQPEEHALQKIYGLAEITFHLDQMVADLLAELVEAFQFLEGFLQANF